MLDFKNVIHHGNRGCRYVRTDIQGNVLSVQNSTIYG